MKITDQVKDIFAGPLDPEMTLPHPDSVNTALDLMGRIARHLKRLQGQAGSKEMMRKFLDYGLPNVRMCLESQPGIDMLIEDLRVDFENALNGKFPK